MDRTVESYPDCLPDRPSSDDGKASGYSLSIYPAFYSRIVMIHSERFLRLVEDAKARVAEISPEETHARQLSGEDVVIIDTREDLEWAAGHIVGAVHLGKGVIERDIEQLVPDTDREMILYCGGGYRSALAADALQRMGYTNVKSMAEGWRGWNERGLPVRR